MLSGENITVRYGERAVVDGVSFHLQEGQWLMLAGPNGAGKSTLIEAIAQGVPYTGVIRWQGEDLRAMKPGQLARRIGVLSQRNGVGYAYRGGFLSGRRGEDHDRVDQALAMTGLLGLRRASMLTLSGGETQRAFLAQVFAQDPQVLILDEPANHLDLNYQQQIFSLIQAWLRQPGRAVLSVVHDLSLARRYGTHAVLMHRGRSVAQGPIDGVMTPEHLNGVYGMDVAAWLGELLGQWQGDKKGHFS